MSISSVGAAASQLPLSLLSQLNGAASDIFSGDDGAEESASATSNALTGSTTASLSNQTLQTLLGLQQDSSTQNTQAPPKAHHHHHHGHGHGGGGSDTLESILDAADSSTDTASTTAGAPSDPLDPEAQNPQTAL